MAKRQIYAIKDGYATTTDGATQVPMTTFNVSTGAPGGTALDNCTIFINGNAAGFNTTNNTAGGERVAALFKVVSGTLSQISTTVHVTAMIDDIAGTPNTDFSVSGSVITYYAIGVPTETIEWLGKIEIHIYQPA